MTTTQRRNSWHLPTIGATSNTGALTATSAKAPTLTKPADDLAAGRYIIAEPSVLDSRWLHLAIAGSDAAGEQGVMKLWGWRQTLSGQGGVELWLPQLLVSGTFTLGTLAGVSGAELSDSLLFADTLAASTDFTGTATNISATAGTDGLAVLAVEQLGLQLIEVELSNNGSGSDSASCMPIVCGGPI